MIYRVVRLNVSAFPHRMVRRLIGAPAGSVVRFVEDCRDAWTPTNLRPTSDGGGRGGILEAAERGVVIGESICFGEQEVAVDEHACRSCGALRRQSTRASASPVAGEHT
jgi:hypothetical protein